MPPRHISTEGELLTGARASAGRLESLFPVRLRQRMASFDVLPDVFLRSK